MRLRHNRCADLEDLISAYVDGQAAPEESRSVQAHVAECPRCAVLLRRQQQTKRLLRLSSADNWNPPDLRLRIVHAAARRPRRLRALWPAGLAACIAILVLIGAFSFGEISAWNAATPVPAAQQPTVAATITASPGHVPCSRMSGQDLARCLGVSLHWLPTVLAEERSSQTAALIHAHPAIRPPLPRERHAITLSVSHTALKGGGIRAVYSPSQVGLVPF